MRGLGGCTKERHYVQWISWINQPFQIFPVPFYSLRYILAKFEVILLLPRHSSLLVNHGMQWMELFFWANWCDVGEWMGKRKSGIWHLAVRTALWPRLVERWVGHINNKPTAEPLWLAGDVLHSHHPSQTGDLWREWISLLKLVAVHRENTSTQWLELLFELNLLENNEDITLKYSWLWFYQSPWVISLKKKKNHTFVTNSPQDGILLTQFFIQILHINHCTATIMTYDHFPERHMS